jgi:hypothetical protein
VTTPQLQSLHILRRQLEAASDGNFSRPDFDLVLMNLGQVKPDAEGAISSKSLSNAGFERVMAFLEEMTAKFNPTIGTYWRERDRRRGHYLNTRQEWQIHRSYEEMRAAGLTYTLESIVSQMSVGRTSAVSELNAQEAFKVIEMLKAAIERQKVNV